MIRCSGKPSAKGRRADGYALQAGDEAGWTLRVRIASGALRWVFCIFRPGGSSCVRFFKGAASAG